jgi:LytS/YehU family sensor histidine kinase
MYVIFLAGTLAVLALSRAAEREREAAALVLRTSRLEKQLVEAQLGVLRAQLHPHFLFNALHAISTLVDWRPREARRMIVRLSELLRLAFTLSEEREVSLSQELDWLEHYLELQQIRFGDRLSVEVRVAPDAIAARVPPLILQPLVENSLKHGIERQSHGGRIGIVAERDGRWLRVRVTDDGPGPIMESSQSGTGVGLRNTRDRLRALYGDDQQLVLRQREPSGAEVLVELPYHEDPVVARRPVEKLTG